MSKLKGSKTEANLKEAFSGESQANRRYLYFANKADIEGQNDVAALFRSTAEARPAMHTATSSTWSSAVTLQLVCQSVPHVRT